MKYQLPFSAGLVVLLLVSCSLPGKIIPKSTIRISLIGTTAREVSVSWIIHQQTGTQTAQIINNSQNPLIFSYSNIDPADFGQVSISITNTQGNQEKITGDSAVVAPGGWVGSEKTLNLSDLGIPADLTDLQIGDLLEFTYPGPPPEQKYLHVINVQNTSTPHQLTVKDSDNRFSPGTWKILSTNSAYFTVWVERDGVRLGTPKTYGNLIGNVNFTYGSLSW